MAYLGTLLLEPVIVGKLQNWCEKKRHVFNVRKYHTFGVKWYQKAPHKYPDHFFLILPSPASAFYWQTQVAVNPAKTVQGEYSSVDILWVKVRSKKDREWILQWKQGWGQIQTTDTQKIINLLQFQLTTSIFCHALTLTVWSSQKVDRGWRARSLIERALRIISCLKKVKEIE